MLPKYILILNSLKAKNLPELVLLNPGGTFYQSSFLETTCKHPPINLYSTS